MSNDQVKQEAKSADRVQEFTCPTCLSDFPGDSNALVQVGQDLGCRHSVCRACHDRLDRANPKCPVCRLPIVLPPRPQAPRPPVGAVENPSQRMLEAAVVLGLHGENGAASRFNTALVRPDGVTCRTVVTLSMAQSLREVFTGPPFSQPDPGLEFFMLPTNGNVFCTTGALDVVHPFRRELDALRIEASRFESLYRTKTVVCHPGPGGKLAPCPQQPAIMSFIGFARLHVLTDDLAASLAKQAELNAAALALVEAAKRCDELDSSASTDSMVRSAKMYAKKMATMTEALTSFEEQKQAFCKFDEKTEEWMPIKSTVHGQMYAYSHELAAALAFSPQAALRLKALRAVDQLLIDHMSFLHPRADANCRIPCDVIRAFLGGWTDFPGASARVEDVKTRLSSALRANLQFLHHQAHGHDGPLLRSRVAMPPLLKALLDAKKDMKRKAADDDNDNDNGNGKRPPPLDD